jgi:hypothetical protein
VRANVKRATDDAGNGSLLTYEKRLPNILAPSADPKTTVKASKKKTAADRVENPMMEVVS